MVGFTKLHGAIIHSSIWSEPMHARCVWITMLAMSNPDGMVEASVSGLARAANVTKEQCVEALAILAAPDPESRDGTTGERVEQQPGGFFIINYANYRDRQTKQQRQAAERQVKSRAACAPEDRRGDQAGNGYVYYAGIPGGGRIKIGFSANPWARIKEHKTANPEIELLATERGSIQLETERHNQFRELLVAQREWFHLTGSLADHVESLRLLRSSDVVLRSSDVVLRSTEEEEEAEAEADNNKSAAAPDVPVLKPEPKKKPEQATRPDDIDADLWAAWLDVRRSKKAPTPSVKAWSLFCAEVAKSSYSTSKALEECVTRCWISFKSDWLKSPFAKPEGKSHSVRVGKQHISGLDSGDPKCDCPQCEQWRWIYNADGTPKERAQ